MLKYCINKRLAKRDKDIIEVRNYIFGSTIYDDETTYMECFYNDYFLQPSDYIELSAYSANATNISNIKFPITSINDDNGSFTINVPYYYKLQLETLIEDKIEEETDSYWWYFYFKDKHYFSEEWETIGGSIRGLEKSLFLQYDNFDYELTNIEIVNDYTVRWKYKRNTDLTYDALSDILFNGEINESGDARALATKTSLINCRRKSLYADDSITVKFRKERNLSTLPISISQSIGEDMYNEINIKEHFVDKETQKAINPIIELEKDMYIPYFKDSNNNFHPIYEIEINMHFRNHNGEDWTVTDDDYWNGIESVALDDKLIGLSVNDNYFSQPYIDNNCKERQSDNLSKLGFTDADVKYQKTRLLKSFLRLSYYDSSDQMKNTLYHYATPYLNTNKLFTNYTKNIDTKGYKRVSDITEKDITGLSVITEVDNIEGVNIDNVEDYRLSSQILIKDRNESTNSSEGYYIYLWKGLSKVDEPQDLYLHIDFNHAGYGRIIPMMLPYGPNGSRTFDDITNDWINGGYSFKTYLRYSFIKFKYEYNSTLSKYIYYIDTDTYGDTVYENNRLILNIYEAKISSIDNNTIETDKYRIEINDFTYNVEPPEHCMLKLGKTEYELENIKKISRLEFSVDKLNENEQDDGDNYICGYKFTRYEFTKPKTIITWKYPIKTIGEQQIYTEEYDTEYPFFPKDIQYHIDLLPIIKTNSSKWEHYIENTTTVDITVDGNVEKNKEISYIRETSLLEDKYIIFKENDTDSIRYNTTCRSFTKGMTMDADVADVVLSIYYKGVLATYTATPSYKVNIYPIEQNNYELNIYSGGQVLSPYKSYVVTTRKYTTPETALIYVEALKNGSLLNSGSLRLENIKINGVKAEESKYKDDYKIGLVGYNGKYSAYLNFSFRNDTYEWVCFAFDVEILNTGLKQNVMVMYSSSLENAYNIVRLEDKELFTFPNTDENVNGTFYKNEGFDYGHKIERTWDDESTWKTMNMYCGIVARRYPMFDKSGFPNYDMSYYEYLPIQYDDYTYNNIDKMIVDDNNCLIQNVVKWQYNYTYKKETPDTEYFIKFENKLYKYTGIEDELNIGNPPKPSNFTLYFTKLTLNENWNPNYLCKKYQYVIYDNKYYFCKEDYDNSSLDTNWEEYFIEMNNTNTFEWLYSNEYDKDMFVKVVGKSVYQDIMTVDGSFYYVEKLYKFEPSVLSEYFTCCDLRTYDGKEEFKGEIDYDYIAKFRFNQPLYVSGISIISLYNNIYENYNIIKSIYTDYPSYSLLTLVPPETTEFKGKVGTIDVTDKLIGQFQMDILPASVLIGNPSYDYDKNKTWLLLSSSSDNQYYLLRERGLTYCILIDAYSYVKKNEIVEIIGYSPINIELSNNGYTIPLYSTENGITTPNEYFVDEDEKYSIFKHASNYNVYKATWNKIEEDYSDFKLDKGQVMFVYVFTDNIDNTCQTCQAINNDSLLLTSAVTKNEIRINLQKLGAADPKE